MNIENVKKGSYILHGHQTLTIPFYVASSTLQSSPHVASSFTIFASGFVIGHIKYSTVKVLFPALVYHMSMKTLILNILNNSFF